MRTPGAAAATWRPLLSDPRERRRAVESALEVGRRLTDLGRVDEAVRAAKAQTSYPNSQHWSPFAVGQGHAGHALLFGYLDDCFPGQGWDRAAHERLALASRSVEDWALVPHGLYGGAAGLAFAARYLSRGGARYGRMLAVLEPIVAERAMALCGQPPPRPEGYPVRYWDLISGLTGLGVCLLFIADGPKSPPALTAVLERLIRLCGGRDARFLWSTPPELTPEEGMRRSFPEGNLNCGLAHGIPGPLSLFASARLRGIRPAGMDEAMENVALWLSRNRADDAWGANWPSVVPSGPYAGAAPAPQPTHAAWCYGSPGVARALWLAGRALDSEAHRSLALDALSALSRRPAAARRLASPTFCHGTAGLLHVVSRTAQEAGSRELSDFARELAMELLAQQDPGSLLGYRAGEGNGRFIDQAGLLDGAPGVALVLLAAATDREPVWDRLFALS